MGSSASAQPGVSVVVPTAGRVEPLRACLASLAACRPQAAEILVVDQSGDARVATLVDGFASIGARVLACDGTGVARGRNDGIRAAAHDAVLVTDDDCTVPPDWVATAWRLHARRPGAIVTGRVLPVGDARAVPSTKDDPVSHDFTGQTHGGALFPNNMVLPRAAVLAIGGFDERFGPAEAAEDNEFCYRWLRRGGELVYEPSLTVWHHDWRTPEQLERMYVRYARGQGFFYAKHLRRGDTVMLRWIARDLYWAARGYAAALLKRRERWTDPRRGILRGLPGGLAHGWRVYGGADERA
jgi:GT2 family glycosyltransferase